MPCLAVLQDEGSRPLFLMLTDDGSDGLRWKMLHSVGMSTACCNRVVAVLGVSAFLELLTVAGYVAEDNYRKLVDIVWPVWREEDPAKEASEGLVRKATQNWRRDKVVVEDTTAVVTHMS